MKRNDIPDLLTKLIAEEGNCYDCLEYLYSEALNARKILDLGVGWGRSTKTFLLACRDGGGHLWSLDWNQEGSINTLVEEIRQMNISDSWTLVEDSAYTVPLHRLPESPDLVFIDYDVDGDYPALLSRYGQLLGPGGKLCLHNTTVFPHAGEAADELVANGWKREDLETRFGFAVLTR